ncbi:MAG: zf-TFIIB domain-containing protein [Gammaproteobacteria bacterium]
MRTSALESGVVKCGNCGANPPADAQRCTYCDAHLTNARCARCLANSIEGDVHCRACGHTLATPIRQLRAKPDQVLACPRCEQALRSVMVGDALIDDCSSCGGVWLEHDMFKEILASREDQGRLTTALDALVPAAQRTAPGAVNEGKNRPETEERFYVPCPHCATMMDRKQFASVSGVVIDVCGKHGIWFDHDELSRIIQFVKAGGMELAAEKVHQKRVARGKARAKRSATSTDTFNDNLVSGSLIEVVFSVLSALLR